MPSTQAIVDRLLSVMEQDIVPLTRAGVKPGNKIFGAAILLESPFSHEDSRDSFKIGHDLRIPKVALRVEMWQPPETTVAG